MPVLSEKDVPSSTIETILVKPKNLRACHYWINESEDTHSKSYSTLFRFLAGLVPSKTREVENLLFTFQTFLVVVPTSEVIVLEVPREEVDARARIQSQFNKFLKNPYQEMAEKSEEKIPDLKFVFGARAEILRSRGDKPIINPNSMLYGQQNR